MILDFLWISYGFLMDFYHFPSDFQWISSSRALFFLAELAEQRRGPPDGQGSEVRPAAQRGGRRGKTRWDHRRKVWHG